MKRFICVLLLIAMLATMLTACGKFECDLCGEEKFGKKYESEFLGQEILICKDCYEDLEDLADMFG